MLELDILQVVMGKGLNGLIGLSDIKELATIDLEACKKTNEPFPHTLISGSGGLGKSALVSAIADELGYHLVVVEAAAMKNRDRIIERLCQAHDEANRVSKRLLFFVDEVHRLHLENQEVFYFPLDKQNPRLTTSNGTITFRPFTMFAATTRMDALDQKSFVGRFDNIWNLKPYSSAIIGIILGIWFHENRLQASTEIVDMIASRSLGTPRQALRIAQKIKNYCVGHSVALVEKTICERIFSLEGIDSVGLTELHNNYLRELRASAGPKGLDALAGKLGQHKDTLLSVIEPSLLSVGFIDTCSRGRVLTSKGIRHLENCSQEIRNDKK